MTAKKFNKYKIYDLIPIAAIVTSVVGILLSLTKFVNLSNNLSTLMISLSLIVTFLFGFYSAILSKKLSRLSRTKRIFLSYNQDMERDAIKIKNELRNKGAKVWVAKERLKPGESIEEIITDAIDDADSVVAIIGNKFSSNMSYEIEIAKLKGKKIIPVIFKSGPLPINISGLKYIDLREKRQLGIKELLDAVT